MNTSTTRHAGDPAHVGWTIGRTPLWLRGIRLAEGEQSTPPAGQAPVETPPAAPAAPAAPSPETMAAQLTPQPPAAPAPAATPATPPAQEPTFSQSYVHELREEAKANRLAHETAQQARETAEKELATAQAKLASFARESAVRTASDGIANPTLLLDSQQFAQSIAEVNLDDPEAVKAAITAFVEKNSAYAATSPLPGTSGGTPSGGTSQKPNTLEGAIAARLGN